MPQPVCVTLVARPRHGGSQWAPGRGAVFLAVTHYWAQLVCASARVRNVSSASPTRREPVGPRPRGRAGRGAIYEYYPRLSVLPLVHVTLLVRPRHGGSWWAPGRGAVLVAVNFKSNIVYISARACDVHGASPTRREPVSPRLRGRACLGALYFSPVRASVIGLVRVLLVVLVHPRHGLIACGFGWG